MNPLTALIMKELKDLFFSKTALLLSLAICFIFGYSFYSAVSLYGTASASAVNNPLYAAGFEPVPGVFVPTFGGLFLIFSLLLPFLFIRLLSLERKQNTLEILLQLPFSLVEILGAKALAAIIFILFILFMSIPALMLWLSWGGRLPLEELTVLAGGYLVYGVLILSISLFSSAVFSTANASIFSLMVIISSWLVDFGKEMNISSLLHVLSGWTVTKNMKYFEEGIFSLKALLYFIVLSMAFFFSAYFLLRFDIRKKWKPIIVVVILALLSIIGVDLFTFNRDLTESRRNSFPQHLAESLGKIKTIKVEINLEKTDSRFRDYENSFLKRLALVRDDVEITMATGDRLKSNYGLFVYRVNEKAETTYSTSEEEIFGIIFDLAGITIGRTPERSHYRGYPLVTTEQQQSAAIYAYFLVIPLVILISFGSKRIMSNRRST
jgi:ABC-type transport system involved in multi-copper enzyme maturation permease subunit